MQRVARKKSSVDVNLLAAAEDSSMEEENEAVSIGDNSIKQKIQETPCRLRVSLLLVGIQKRVQTTRRLSSPERQNMKFTT